MFECNVMNFSSQLGYRCVFCRQYNPPRQQRPQAATLPKNTILIEEMDSSVVKEDETSESKDGDEAANTSDIVRESTEGDEHVGKVSSSPEGSMKSEKEEMEIITDEEVSQAQLVEQEETSESKEEEKKED